MALLSLLLSVLTLALPWALGRLHLADTIVGIYIDGIINNHVLVVIVTAAAEVAASPLKMLDND